MLIYIQYDCRFHIARSLKQMRKEAWGLGRVCGVSDRRFGKRHSTDINVKITISRHRLQMITTHTHLTIVSQKFQTDYCIQYLYELITCEIIKGLR